jgi:hypothetical protein
MRARTVRIARSFHQHRLVRMTNGDRVNGIVAEGHGFAPSHDVGSHAHGVGTRLLARERSS